MRRRLVRIFAILIILIVGTGIAAAIVYGRQGLDPEELAAYAGAKIAIDARGIPTIDAAGWLEAVEAQGFVVASERLFQMDLMRRAAGGRLAEWFGPAALERDRSRRLEDWEGVAERAYQGLPEEEKRYLEAYRRGVNRFIEENAWRWGLEYVVLRARPELWEGRDTMLVFLGMVEQLTAYSGTEALVSKWEEHLPPEWHAFLFTIDHPWNDPMFGTKPRARPELPLAKALPRRAIDASDQLAALDAGGGDAQLGSNNWAWCGETGCFLANDPHLAANVPHLWYAVRLRVAKDDWVAGVSIPGMPGAILGMNPHLAWAFTNVGEDVDDLLLEQLSPDGENYLVSADGNGEVWKPITRKEHVIRVRGGGEEKIFSRHTHRGPLVQRPVLGEAWYSRQWLAYTEGTLRLPINYMRAKSIEEMNAALDTFRLPAQNVLIADRLGNLAYRASGTGIVRKIDGRKPQRAVDGEWVGLAPASTRPRQLFYVKDTGEDHPRQIATANERIWVDEYGHRWAEDLRKDRIRTVLASRDDFSREDMEKLQRDTTSRYHRLLVEWVRARVAPADAAGEEIVERWTKWSGAATDDPQTFSEAVAIETALVRACVERARRAYLPEKAASLAYEHWQKSAWMITALEAPDGMAVFGFDERELAGRLLELVKSRPAKPYHQENRWAAQHPFVGRIPVIGDRFAVGTPDQYGWRGIVRVENPTYGASVRLVWDLSKPENSTWSLILGQSGHIRSRHYQDLQADYHAGKPFPVFGENW